MNLQVPLLTGGGVERNIEATQVWGFKAVEVLVLVDGGNADSQKRFLCEFDNNPHPQSDKSSPKP